ncbi:type VI secretion system lipoprotein TssJ [Aestuariispira ectoiniformans]|uniref:type VI secretion system lipoprotein TssJ n=1 Tax=Aestuariispira ectoiniformans TaxID=2775080 RepID=UPI00223AD9B4|nr:type VI secretion system lipoprotein TssJ [Aestuariispira ectoiniformans]
MNRVTGFISAAILSVLLVGCDTATKVAEVVWDPDIQVGAEEAQPSKISLHAYAAGDVNKNFNGEPSPVVVKVMALSSDHRLFSYDFFSLADAMDETMGKTLLANLDEVLLEPDSYKILGPYELPEGTKKIAVIAEYLDIKTAVWRGSISVKDLGSDDRFLMLLLDEEVRLMKDEG